MFISSPERSVLMLRQRAGNSRRHGMIVWDYHVVALATLTPPATAAASAPTADCYVLDVDSTLPFPCALDSYLAASFPSAASAPVRPLFRLVSAAAYTAHFASDRSHMRREDGSWHAPPPSWDNIQPANTPATSNNIQAYIAMQQPQHEDTSQQEDERSEQEQYGRVLTMQQLAEALGVHQQQLQQEHGVGEDRSAVR